MFIALYGVFGHRCIGEDTKLGFEKEGHTVLPFPGPPWVRSDNTVEASAVLGVTRLDPESRS